MLERAEVQGCRIPPTIGGPAGEEVVNKQNLGVAEVLAGVGGHWLRFAAQADSPWGPGI